MIKILEQKCNSPIGVWNEYICRFLTLNTQCNISLKLGKNVVTDFAYFSIYGIKYELSFVLNPQQYDCNMRINIIVVLSLGLVYMACNKKYNEILYSVATLNESDLKKSFEALIKLFGTYFDLPKS